MIIELCVNYLDWWFFAGLFDNALCVARGVGR